MRTNIKTAIATGLVALATILPKAKAGEVAGDIGYVMPENSEAAYVEANAFYRLPGGVNGFTFMDFSDGGYFGKTTLTRSMKGNLAARAQIVHANGLASAGKAGVEYKVKTPGDSCLKVRAAANVESGDVEAGFFTAVPLPWNVLLTAFGDANVSGKDRPKWSYGEAELSKEIANTGVRVGVGVSKAGDEDPKPRLTVRIPFGK